jgi:hypothetical protein
VHRIRKNIPIRQRAGISVSCVVRIKGEITKNKAIETILLVHEGPSLVCRTKDLNLSTCPSVASEELPLVYFP